MQGFSCYNVMFLPESLCSTLFALFIKGLLKEGLGLFGFCFGLFGCGFFGALA
jgi:hypothetical protein